MVEVVQDLLDYVTYAGGVGRRRADAVSGVGSVKAGAHDCAFVADEDTTDTHGPKISPLQDIVYDEVLDRPFAEKEYGVRLLELSHRGERLMAELAQKYDQVDRLVEHDPLWRSRLLPSLLRKVCEGLRRVQLILARELQEVWKMTFQPLFYPAEIETLTEALPGGWLDLEDLFLTVHLLLRYLSEMMRLAGDLVKEVPNTRAMSRSQIREAATRPEVQRLVRHAASKLPFLGIGFGDREGPGENLNPAEAAESPLSEALAILNEVLMVEMQDLLSDLHRSTYRAFIRVVAAYARWKKTCKEARKAKAAEVKAAIDKQNAAARKMRSLRSVVNMEDVDDDAGSEEDSAAAASSSGPKVPKAPPAQRTEPARAESEAGRMGRRRGSVYTKTTQSSESHSGHGVPEGKGTSKEAGHVLPPAAPPAERMESHKEREVKPPEGAPVGRRRGSVYVQPAQPGSSDLNKLD